MNILLLDTESQGHPSRLPFIYSVYYLFEFAETPIIHCVHRMCVHDHLGHGLHDCAEKVSTDLVAN